MEKWHVFDTVSCADSKGIYAETVVSSDSLWLDGHFPAEPILPGIAQLGMVFQLIRRCLGGKHRLCGLKRVRFRQLIRPGERLQIFINPVRDETSMFNFKVVAKDEIACSGVINVTNEPSEPFVR